MVLLTTTPLGGRLALVVVLELPAGRGGRIVMFLTIPAGICVAPVVDRSSARRGMSVALGLRCCLEQTTLTKSAPIEPDRRAARPSPA